MFNFQLDKHKNKGEKDGVEHIWFSNKIDDEIDFI